MIRLTKILLLIPFLIPTTSFGQIGHSLSMNYGITSIFSLDDEEVFPSGLGYESTYAPSWGLEYSLIFGDDSEFEVSVGFSHLQLDFEAMNSPILVDPSGNLISGDRYLSLFNYLIDLKGHYRFKLNRQSYIRTGLGLTHVYRYRSLFTNSVEIGSAFDARTDYSDGNSWGISLGVRYEYEVLNLKRNGMNVLIGIRARSLFNLYNYDSSPPFRVSPEYFAGLSYTFKKKRNRF